MGKGKGKKEVEGEKEKEGEKLLGSPTFEEVENGRLRCIETGHEVPPTAQAKDSYARTKHCRLGLIDAALARNKPPLNMFRQDPLSRSKLICKLTGVTINKCEEHIWKHINGKRFLNMLEKKEAEKQTTPKQRDQTSERLSKPKADGLKKNKNKKEEEEEEEEESVSELAPEDCELMNLTILAENGDQTPERASKPKADGLKEKEKKKKKKMKQKENVSKVVSEEMNSSNKDIDSEEADFWMPPVGERWDFDDGGDRWGSGSEPEPEPETEDTNGADSTSEEIKDGAKEISEWTKRAAIELGPSSSGSGSREKKKKTESTR